MPSIEFKGVPAAESPPYAQYFQRACIRWQQRHDIALPTHVYLAERFGMTSTKVFTDVIRGRYIPPAPVILQIARECGDSVEEHLTVANIDLARRQMAHYDTFASLIRFAEHYLQKDASLRVARDLLLATQERAWVEHASRWRDMAEEILVSKLPPDQKVRLIAQAIDAAQGHAPQGKRLVARA